MTSSQDGVAEIIITEESESEGSQPLDLSRGRLTSLDMDSDVVKWIDCIDNRQLDDEEDSFSISNLVEDISTCPVLEQQQCRINLKKSHKARTSQSCFSRYVKRKKPRRRSKIDIPPPNLIPEIDLVNSPGTSCCNYDKNVSSAERPDHSKLMMSEESHNNAKSPTPPPHITSKRGHNGWEDCLRPRPQQVEHFQSLMLLKMRNKANQGHAKIKMDYEKPHSVKRKLYFEDRMLNKRVSRYMGSKSSSDFTSTSDVDNSDLNYDAVFHTNGERFVNDSSGILSNEKIHAPNQTSKSDKDEEIEQKQVETIYSSTSDNMKKEDESLLDGALSTCAGDILWAKLGSTRWWPAIVVWGEDCGQVPARAGQIWVFWFGDHKISELPNDKLLNFVNGFRSKYSDSPGKTFKRGVVEAVMEIAVRADVHNLVADTMLIQWAKQGFPTGCNKTNPYLPDPASPYPESVRSHLNRIKDLYLQAMEADAKLAQETKNARQEQLENKDSMLKKVREGKCNIQDICIACDSLDVTVTHEHPLFEGGLCKQCKDEIVDTMFAYGDDGTNVYCVICGNPGILLICDNGECNRCYCTGCIEVLVSIEAREKAEAADPWLCYLCQECEEDESNGLIQRKENWQQNIVQFYQPEKHVQIPSLEAYKDKRPIRVLSLFDGIGTGKLVLDQLGFDIDVYYASEVDLDAKNVVTMHYGDQVKHLGDVELLSDNQVSKLCPIDLLIGGSPCNDLSLVNPARKGLFDLTGTGRLFFDFFRVLKAVQLANQGRHVFWLYENVASMPQEYRRTINRFLQCEPSMIDSKFFSPQNRARYFWGNVPGMYTPLQPHLTEQTITLDSVLTPGCNRTAQVEKIRTVTTRSNSLKQGKKAIHPVRMNGTSDVLWVTELEQVFGFPKHYTDVGNIPLGRRQQLLGKAWSVPVIKHLLTPLKSFFRTSYRNQVNTAVQTYSSSDESSISVTNKSLPHEDTNINNITANATNTANNQVLPSDDFYAIDNDSPSIQSSIHEYPSIIDIHTNETVDCDEIRDSDHDLLSTF